MQISMLATRLPDSLDKQFFLLCSTGTHALHFSDGKAG